MTVLKNIKPSVQGRKDKITRVMGPKSRLLLLAIE
jgi:hypothetical protein